MMAQFWALRSKTSLPECIKSGALKHTTQNPARASQAQAPRRTLTVSIVSLGSKLVASLAAAFFGVTAGIAAPLTEWQSQVPVIHIGIVTNENADYEIARREPFRAYLEKRLKTPVELIPLSDYRTLIDAHVTNRVEYAIHSASSYVIAERLCGCIDAIGVPADSDGRTGYYSLIVAHKNAAKSGLDDVNGAHLALGSDRSIAGSVFPRSALAIENIQPQQITQTDTLIDGVQGVLDGRYDASAAWSNMAGKTSDGYSVGTLVDVMRNRPEAMQDLAIVWRSRLIPYGPHAIRADLPPTLKIQITEALLALPETDPVLMNSASFPLAGPFRQTRPDAYAPLGRALGLGDISSAQRQALVADEVE